MKYIAEGEDAVEIRFPPHWFQFPPISPNKMQSLMCLRLAPAPPPTNSCFSGETIRFPERLSSLVCQAGKGKAARDTVTIECTNCTQKGVEKRSNGVSRYTTQKNKRNTTGKLELKKFCPYCNKHTLHAEIKK